MKITRLYTIKEFIHIIVNFANYRINNFINRNIIFSKEINDLAIKFGFKIFRNKNFFIYKKDQIEIFCRVNSSDQLVFKQVFVDKEYDCVFEIIKLYNLKVENIIDCGANIGLSSIYFKLEFPNSKICLIEPFIDNYNLLIENLIPYNNVKTILGAIWHKKTNLRIERSFRDKKEWAIQVEECFENSDLKSFTINEIMSIMHFEVIDILKIDIEGAEKQLFDNEISSLDFLDVTKVLVIEIHDEYNCRDMIYEILMKKKFRIKEFGELTVAINENFINYE